MARKILLADDSVTAQNMGRKILTDAGYEVITVNNGSAALKKISENKPDLIVLDVYMPGYSGLEVCQRLKENHETARIPVLLTVGKLEPFKPEEAKRARAEAYIVKPFEASELLSTLTKLENKIVPRAEGSKPGRFARANAALDEGRYDKTVDDNEDSGWKNRIAFPSKKKTKPVEEEHGDDPAIYNAVNRDLRTTVERHEELKPPPKEDETRVDVAALAPEGLPKDVTPEEIAALASAAAQMKGKFGENRSVEPAAEPAAVSHEAKTDAPAVFEAQRKEVSAPDAPLATFAGQKSEAEQKEAENHQAEKVPEKFGDKFEAKSEEKTETPVEAASVAASAPTNGASAASSAPAASAHSSSAALAVAQMPVSEPMTMAVAAGAEALAKGSRWTAVAAALAPEEGSISLELEMQKAHAAFAASAAAETGSVVIIPQARPAPEPVAPVEPPVAQSASPVEVAPEPVPPSPAMAATDIADPAPVPPADAPYSTPAEPVVPKVKAFESVSSWVKTQQVPAVSAEPARSPQFTPSIEDVPADPSASTVPELLADAPAPAADQHIQQAAVETNGKTEDAKEEPRHEGSPEKSSLEPEKENALPRPASPQEEEAERAQGMQAQPATIESRIESPTESETDTPAPTEAGTEPVAGPPAATQAPITASETASAEPAAAEAPERADHNDANNKDSDIASTTAAAWASWRRIRESGDLKSPSPPASSRQSESQPGAFASLRPRQETAARAVAAGAEESGAEESEQKVPAAQDSESPEIASIVDSVLADMRPRIVAEISKKLNKKK